MYYYFVLFLLILLFFYHNLIIFYIRLSYHENVQLKINIYIEKSLDIDKSKKYYVI